MNEGLEKYRGDAGCVHFVGCAGVGTLPLLRIFYENGFRVSGSDLVDSPAFDWFRERGVRIGMGHAHGNLPPDDGKNLLLVRSSAIPDDNPELVEARRRGARLILRGEALAEILTLYRRPVTVSGSHGKTSVSAMLAFLLRELGFAPGFLIGGFIRGWNSVNGEAGQGGDFFASEVDESDGTHTLARSFVGIVTNVEDDHAWSLGGMAALETNFRRYAAQSEHLIYVGSPETDKLFSTHPNARRLDADLTHHAAELALFDPESLARWGAWQKIDALCALAGAAACGIPPADAARALSRFPGVERRLTTRFENDSYLLIEDYAHHPTELRASLAALRELHPGRRLVVCFQPHRYARLERYFAEFAEILGTADRILVTPVFAAWTASGRYSSADLARAVGEKACAVSGTWADIAGTVAETMKPNDLVAVIGAGDLHELIPFLAARMAAD